jgi:hypothetical protein
MTGFDPEQKARAFLNLLRDHESGFGEQLQREFRSLTKEQATQTVTELKNKSDQVKAEYDAGGTVIGVTLPIDVGFSMYLVK